MTSAPVTSVRGVLLAVAALVGTAAPRMIAAQAPAQPAPGRVAGRVVDAETSRPLVSARVTVMGQGGVVETDLDGRFRSAPVAPGRYSVRAALIGYSAAQVDSVVVTAGQTTVLSLTLRTAPVQLAELVTVSDKPERISSSAGLLAAQQSAMAVVDGISAETINRTPDSDAGQAITRITGLAVVADKVVVRGLAERYSSSLLNGVEIASPDPDRKFVPLGAFDADLIESIVAAKTATPDRPGDFAGGLVDIRTKEFPDNFLASIALSQGWNSQSTFESFPRAPRSGDDRFGFNGSGRGFQPMAPGADIERYNESLRNVWTPASEKADLGTGVKASLGGRRDYGSNTLGYILSFDYGTGRLYNPDRFDYQGEAPIHFNEGIEEAAWSGIANLNYRIGSSTKLGFKNFYSRSSDETARIGYGGDNGDGPSVNYQMRFVEQFIYQAQLTGDHYLPWLGRSRLEWKGSYGQAGQDDLDNRQLRYLDGGSGYKLSNIRPHNRYNTELQDDSWSGQADWSLPFKLRTTDDAQIKIGGAYRSKDRSFISTGLHLEAQGAFPDDELGLPPELLLAPENLGPGQLLYTEARILSPYDATESVAAAYGMVDFELLPSLRLVAGARYERWLAHLEERNTNEGPANIVERDNGDLLWSANLTWALSKKTNLRLAGFRTVARPDLRELSVSGYTETVGGFETIGNPNLQRATVLNADARFEVYPAAEEIFAVSGFFKRFDLPLVTTYTYAGGNVVRPDNGNYATSYGLELEARKRLGFLLHSLQSLLLAGNVTLLRSQVILTGGEATVIGRYNTDLQFQGQSPYLVNASLTWASPSSNLTMSVLGNAFGDRILRYGQAGASGQLNEQGPDLIEKGRVQLDAKAKYRFWDHWGISVSGRNLTNAPVELLDDAPPGSGGPPIVRGYVRNGVTISLELSYAY